MTEIIVIIAQQLLTEDLHREGNSVKNACLTEAAFRTIVRWLAADTWPDGARLPAMRRLAEQLHVSPPTIQQACNRAAALGLIAVRPRSPAIVLPGAAAAARNLLAQDQARQMHRRLAILIPDKYFPLADAPFQQRMANEVIMAGKARGFHVQIVPIPSDADMHFAHRIIRGYDAGFVIEMQTCNIAMLFALSERAFPVLLFNRHVPGLNAPSLNTDDYGAARKLAQLMVECGHRNVSLLAVADYDAVLGKRSAVDGWTDTLEELGVLRECVLPIIYSRHRIIALDAVIRLRPRITAIAWFGRLPANLAGLLQQRQLKLGRDLSVAAIGSSSGKGNTNNDMITSFEIDWKRAGECTIEMITRMLAGESHPKDIRVALNIHQTASIAAPAETAVAGL